MSTTGVELLRQGLSDYTVLTISWVHDEKDLRIHFLPPPGGPTDVIVLRFVWVIDVAIDMAFGNSIGAPFLFETRCSPLSSPASGWEVVLDFAGAPEGGIGFKCNDIVLEEGDTDRQRA